MASLVDVAWLSDPTPLVPATDPNLPAREVHRVTLTTATLVCAPWVTAAAGQRLPLDEAAAVGPLCPACWADPTPTT